MAKVAIRKKSKQDSDKKSSKQAAKQKPADNADDNGLAEYQAMLDQKKADDPNQCLFC